jgi:hypothetical protein
MTSADGDLFTGINGLVEEEHRLREPSKAEARSVDTVEHSQQ